MHPEKCQPLDPAAGLEGLLCIPFSEDNTDHMAETDQAQEREEEKRDENRCRCCLGDEDELIQNNSKRAFP